MNVAIIKYNAGNVQSVQFALQRLGANAIITDKKQDIEAADKVIFPGVGNAASAMKYLKGSGLDKIILSLGQPVLGICLGLQLLCSHSSEGNTPCLGIFDTTVKQFDDQSFQNKNLLPMKIPHMGWNTITDVSDPLFTDVEEESFVYFVHSYYAEISADTIATTDYIVPFSAALQKDNFYGVQFHVEKSSAVGEKILSNFLKLV
jgi:imidazole glycerol-phosphate synthase subunit HisH